MAMQQNDKIRLLTAGRNLATAPGLEIGPRDAPLLRKSHCNVVYADYADAATIRANLHDPAIDPAQVVDIDIVTGGGKISAATAQKFSYIVASHVAEHIPDFLGWLIDLRGVLEDGGTVGLGIPDRRFTFDRARPESTISEAVEAFLLEYDRPSPRQIFDSAWQSFDISVSQAWQGDIPPSGDLENRQSRLVPAFQLVRNVLAEGKYNDAHCWVFTPASFLALMHHAAKMELLPLTLDSFYPTESGGYEFFAVFRRDDCVAAADIVGSITQARVLLAASRAEAEFAANHVDPDVVALRAEVIRWRYSFETLVTSRSWRLTAPCRWVIELLRK